MIKEKLEALRLRAGAMLRERKERAAEARMRRHAANPPGVTVFEWQVRSAHILSWGAWAIAAYFFWSYCTGTAGDQASALHLSHAGTWTGDLLFYFPLIVGFAGLSLAVPYLAKSIIPIFVVFSWRSHFWPKLASLVLVFGVSFALIASSFSVMGGTIIEHGRAAAVATEQVQNQRGALRAQIEGEQGDLRDMMNNRNAYMAQAANVGAAGWQTYIDQARRTNDVRLPMIERAMGAALSADAKRAHIATMRAQLGASATVASVEATPVTSDTAKIADAMGFVRLTWPIIMSVLNDIVCLFLGWIAYHLEKIRSQQLGVAGGIPRHPWMIEDRSAEAAIADVTPREAARAVFNAGGTREQAEAAARSAAAVRVRETTLRDADTEEVIIDKDGDLATLVREHTRKKKDKDGKPIKVVVPAGPPQPDERGVEVDGGGRIASTAPVPNGEDDESKAGNEKTGSDASKANFGDGFGNGVESEDMQNHSAENHGEAEPPNNGNDATYETERSEPTIHPEPSELTEEAAAELLGLTEPVEAVENTEAFEGPTQEENAEANEAADDNNVPEAQTDPLDQGIAAAFADAQQQRQPQTDPRFLLESVK